ncbi:MAG: efflux RND transporter permease subunit [Aminobacterium sp.]|jgi:HAE1 family hydrophobic/amphiphilic exporter-1|uniref:efflux RND transporter permease subunit n=1 Tax=unclassified Aminobacterium TaxID=2685012 RepID=UPI001BCFED55|nr:MULTISPECIES: efflux RND transporter permease subunit [unclassified Aminobacterium]MDD2206429.1 efflux RND transporter permease subunit [Aminobacterium sp.]MDD3426693.1 efflux RND transporter permease subunit [Aminobacterium sp.]MDD3706920.1 efflux RND transporter permease subunit [Aminobacterium sp.]MDD4228236.1 efflux RND transporter permease subunit [Aminobacterium sp.]MDD4551273.1 efflux RND transporter permease subunit [Aminobacterium sp.]
MKFLRVFIERPVFTSVTVLLAVVLGLYSYFNIGVALVPDVDIPVVSVMTAYSGAGPSEIELLVSKPIEDAVSKVEGVKRIRSYSLEGVSFVVVEFEYNVNISEATMDISNRVKAISATLPDDSEDPVTEKFDINAFPFMTIAISSNLPPEYAYDIVEDKVQRRLTQIQGVASAEILGGLQREIHVYLDPVKLYQYKISPEKIIQVLNANNVNDPSGHIIQGRKERSVRVLGEVKDPDELEDIRISLEGTTSIRLGDVGQIVDTTEEPRGYAKYEGKEAILIDCIATPGSNVVEVSDRIRSELEDIIPFLPTGFEVTITDDISTFIREAIRNVFRDMLIGILLTGLVLFLFLQRFSLTFVVAAAMPTAVISTFIPMYISDITMNMMSTLGLAISVGILVNNSILVLENIYRFRDLGEEAFVASEKGTADIALSVFSTTATNLGVFIPVAFMKGIAGQFLQDFALTIVFATIFSLWVAMTLTPMVAARVPYGTEPSDFSRKATAWWSWLYSKFDKAHDVLVDKALDHNYLTLGLFALAFLASLFLVPFLGVEFIPRVDRGLMEISLELPSASSLAYTEEVTEKVEKYVRSLSGVKAIEIAVGGSRSEVGVNRSRLKVVLTDDPKRPSSFELAERLREYFAVIPDVTASISASVSGGGSPGKPIQILISGENIGELNKIAGQVMEKMRQTQGVVDVDTNWRLGRPEFQILPIPWKLGLLGISVRDVTETVRNYITGKKAGVFRVEGKEYDIVSLLDFQRRSSLNKIEEFPIATPSGFVPLSSLAEFTYGVGPTSILRSDRIRAITIEADVNGRSVGSAFEEIQDKIHEISLPTGYRFSFAGEVEDIQENFYYLYVAFGMAIILTFLMIAAILESYLYAFVIMITLPLSAIGVIPFLYFTRTAVSLYGLLGVVMLVGLVVNNAIVIIDYAEKSRKGGLAPREAIRQACLVRLRPIIMADLTSIIAMIPLALGLGAGGPYRAPMAIVVIGGLIAGGTLALFAIPPIYTILHRRTSV